MALFAVAWADGKLDADEADGIVRCAIDEGLDLEDIQVLERAATEPVTLAPIARDGMTREDRLFVYAVACWIAKMDGSVTIDESFALAQLGDALGVPERPRAEAEAAAAQVAALPEGSRPARYDLSKVRQIIGERLKNTAEARRDPS